MARLQIADQTRVAPGQSVGGIISAPQANGGEIAGRQLQQLGQQVERASQFAAQVQTQALEQQNEARVNEALTAAQQVALEERRAYSQRRGANAMPDAEGLEGQPLTEFYSKRFDQALPDIARRLNLNDFQTEVFRQKSAPLALSFRSGAMGHEQEQADVYAKGVYETAVAANTEAALANWDNPEALAISLSQMRDATIAEARRVGLDERGALMAVRTNESKALATIVAAQADEDPLAARAFRDTNAGRMLPSDLEKANDLINPAVQQIEIAGAVAQQMMAGQPIEAATTEPGQPTPTRTEPARLVAPLVNMPRVRSAYGRRTPVRTSNGRMSSANHDGVDFAVPAGTPVYAQGAGVVLRAGENGGLGNFVEVDYGGGLVLGYAHLQGFNVKEGDTVSPGQTFGRVGSTGNSTGPHLHVRGRLNGESIDPLEYLQGRAAPPRAASQPGQRSGPTRREMNAWAEERYGQNPRALAQARQEISRRFSEIDAEERELREGALETAYRTIDGGGDLSASQLAAVRQYAPGSLNTIENYREARDAPPTVRSDPALLLAIASNPQLVADMTPEEIVAKYHNQLSQSDLLSVVGQSARAAISGGNQLATRAQEATVVPGTAFSAAWTRALDTRGIDRTPSGRTGDDERQALAIMSTEVRGRILDKQRTLGRQLNEPEIEAEIAASLGQLAWTRPAGLLNGREAGFATNYDTIPAASRRTTRDAEKSRLGRDPTEDEVYAAYVRSRIGGR